MEIVRYTLASASPRRRELLKEILPDFAVAKVEADETCLIDSPAQRVMYTAGVKAEKYQPREGELLITADTVVYCQGCFLGKPKDEEQAKEMLSLLNHKTHSVWTGVCLKTCLSLDFFAEESLVRIEMSDKEIDDYVATKSPLDKAGAYGIQDPLLHADLVKGSYSNVVGLPVEKLKQVIGERS